MAKKKAQQNPTVLLILFGLLAVALLFLVITVQKNFDYDNTGLITNTASRIQQINNPR